MLGLDARFGLPGEMLGSVANEIDKALFRFVVKIQIKGTAYLVIAELTDDFGHVVKINKTLVNGAFDECVVRIVLVELLDAWKRECGVDICSGRVVPQTNIAANNLSSHFSIVGALGRNFELEKDGGKLFQSTRQGCCHLRGAIFPVSGGVLGKSIQRPSVDGLQGFYLSLDGRKGSFNARFGVFSLRVEVDCLPDGDDRQDDRHDSRNQTSYAESVHDDPIEKPNK